MLASMWNRRSRLNGFRSIRTLAARKPKVSIAVLHAVPMHALSNVNCDSLKEDWGPEDGPNTDGKDERHGIKHKQEH